MAFCIFLCITVLGIFLIFYNANYRKFYYGINLKILLLDILKNDMGEMRQDGIIFLFLASF